MWKKWLLVWCHEVFFLVSVEINKKNAGEWRGLDLVCLSRGRSYWEVKKIQTQPTNRLVFGWELFGLRCGAHWLAELGALPPKGGLGSSAFSATDTPFRDRSHLYSCNGDACSESNSSRSHLVVGRFFVCCLAKKSKTWRRLMGDHWFGWFVWDLKTLRLPLRDTPSSIWCIDWFATLIFREKICLYMHPSEF